MSKAALPVLIATALALALPSEVAAQEACPAGDTNCAASAAVARAINDEMDHNRIHELWDNNTSEWLKSKGTQDTFLLYFGQASTAFSPGVQKRTIITEGLGRDQQSNIPYYGRTYKVLLTNGFEFYESMILIRENGRWVLSGFNIMPAPH